MAVLSLVGLLLVGIIAFAAANIDDIFILMGFFSNPRHQAQHIVLGQYLGFGFLVGLSMVASLLRLVVSARLVGLTGLIPVAIGVKKLIDIRAHRGKPETQDSAKGRFAGSSKVLEIATVTFTDGGDDFGVFIPLFATYGTTSEVIVLVTAFMLMTGIYCVVGHYVARKSVLARSIERFGQWILPIVLISVGVLVLAESILSV